MAPGKRAASSSPRQGDRPVIRCSHSLSSRAFLSQKHRGSHVGVCQGTPKEEKGKDSGPAVGGESEEGVAEKADPGSVTLGHL